MRKIVQIILLGTLFLPLITFGQAQEGTIKVGKAEMKGFTAKSNYDKALVEEAMKIKLTEAGLKKFNKKKKFYTFREITWPEISTSKIDLYYKVTGKRNKSKILFIVSKGYDNYVTSATDATTAASINTFLAQVDAMVAHNEAIKKKEQEVLLMNQKLEKDKADMKKAEDEKRKTERELEDMKKK